MLGPEKVPGIGFPGTMLVILVEESIWGLWLRLEDRVAPVPAEHRQKRIDGRCRNA